jgi:hypothetical protein
MNTLGYIFIWLVGGVIMQNICDLLQTRYWETFYENNLILLLVSLMAINITTISVIMTKLKEISESAPTNFNKTKNAMRESINEQVSLIIASVLLLMLKKSQICILTPYAFWWNSGLHAIFIGAVHILWDTAKGVFSLLEFESVTNKESKK